MNTKGEDLRYHFNINGKQITLGFQGDINLLRALQAEFGNSGNKELANTIDDYINECKARQHFIIIASDEMAIGNGGQNEFIGKNEMEL